MDRNEPTTTSCGAQHPRRDEVTCQQRRLHERWAHEWRTMRIEDEALVWETVAWVDLPEAVDRAHRIKARAAARSLTR